MSDLRIKVADEWIDLLPERAIFWPTQSTLFISDLHLGKAATFRAHGLRVPEGAMVDDLNRLSAVLTRTKAARLIVLGDMLHATAGKNASAMRAVALWRASLPTLDFWLIRGNHDRRAGDPPESWGITVHDPAYNLPPFRLHHEPIYPTTGYTLAGHLHPAIRLTGSAHETLKVPCFWLAKKVGVLPAFASFAGAEVVRPGKHDRVFLAGERHVVRLGPPDPVPPPGEGESP